MKISRFKKGVAFAVSATLMCGAFFGCSPSPKADDYYTGVAANTADTSGGVAVVVNGVEIGENAIDAYISEFRKINSLEDDKAFGEYMGSAGYTPESLRQAVVDMYVERELIRQAAAENGIEVTEAEVDKALENAKESIGSNSKWRIMLKQSGMTEQQYKEQLESKLLQNKLYYLLTGTSEFAAQAEQFLGQMEENGGAELANLLRSGMEALESPNESEEITADDDLILEFIKVYEADYADATSLEGIPEEVIELYRPYADSSAKQQVLSDYLEKYKNDADIKENDLPENASYIVEVIVAQPEEGSDAQAADGAASEGEPGAGEAAATTDAAANGNVEGEVAPSEASSSEAQ